jgi:hypothetical protein
LPTQVLEAGIPRHATCREISALADAIDSEVDVHAGQSLQPAESERLMYIVYVVYVVHIYCETKNGLLSSHSCARPS